MSNSFKALKSYVEKRIRRNAEIRDINNLEPNETISEGMKNLWDCMNDKFAKKNLWWATRYARSQARIKELEEKLAERRTELLELGAIWEEHSNVEHCPRADRDNLIAAGHRLRRLLSAYSSTAWRDWYNSRDTTNEARGRWFSHREAPVDVLPLIPVEEKITMVVLREVVQLDGHNTTEVLVLDNIAFEFLTRYAEFGYSYGQQVARHMYELAQVVGRNVVECVESEYPNVSMHNRNTIMFAQRVGGYERFVNANMKWAPIAHPNFDDSQRSILRKAAHALGLNYEDRRKGPKRKSIQPSL